VAAIGGLAGAQPIAHALEAERRRAPLAVEPRASQSGRRHAAPVLKRRRPGQMAFIFSH
jgi:hypothetical protein